MGTCEYVAQRLTPKPSWLPAPSTSRKLDLSNESNTHQLAGGVGVAAFACLLVSFIAQKRKWKPSGTSGVKAGALVFLLLLFCLIFVFRDPALLMVEWTRASQADETVRYQYQVRSDSGSRHTVSGDQARNVAFFGSSRSFRVVTEGDGYASCQSSGGGSVDGMRHGPDLVGGRIAVGIRGRSRCRCE